MDQLQTQIHALQHAGFIFDSDAIYTRLVRQPDTLHPALLRAHLMKDKCFTHIHYYPSIDSTNSAAEDLVNQGAPTPMVVLAGQQTGGRGRLGRSWYSNDPGNLYVSFAFTPNLPPHQMEKFTLWQGMAICAVLNEAFDLPIKVKWPNDLIAGGKKIAGMLSEARVDAGYTRIVVFGLGLNVNSQINDWPHELQRTASSLAQTTGYWLDIHAIASAVIRATIDAYESFIAGAFARHFTRRWDLYDALRGQVVTVGAHDGHYTGRAIGIEPDGALLVETENGVQRTFKAGDVTLHKVYQDNS